MLVEVDAVELVLVEMLEVVLVVSRMTLFVNDVVCVWALAKDSGNDNRRETKAMLMRMYEPIFLPNRATFHTYLTGTTLHHIQGYRSQTTAGS